jgi:hypothetical protein
MGWSGWLPGTGLVVLDVMRRLVEGRLPELVMAGITEHQEVPHARPRSAASRAAVQMQGFHPTCAIPGHSW